MVKDRFNEYYTELYNKLKEKWPTIQKSTKLTDAPANLPAVYVRQIGGSAKVDTLSGTSEERLIGIEVQFFAKKQSDVRTMSDTAIEFMVETLFFANTYAAPMENTEDTSIYRFICRFEKTDV